MPIIIKANPEPWERKQISSKLKEGYRISTIIKANPEFLESITEMVPHKRNDKQYQSRTKWRLSKCKGNI